MNQQHGTPLKWRKYLKLVEFDLLDEAELARQVKRFRACDAEALIEHVRGCLVDDKLRQVDSLHVVKLVPMDQQGQLPNFRLRCIAEIDSLRAFLGRSVPGRFVEVWCCSTRSDRAVLSVAGRLLFSCEGTPRVQVVEQVWRCSPRLLEELGEEFEYTCVRATRGGWGRSYQMAMIHVPGTERVSEESVIDEFRHSILTIERNRERIERFCEHLEARGASCYSLEYKLIDGRLYIIDWDTLADRLIC